MTDIHRAPAPFAVTPEQIEAGLKPAQTAVPQPPRKVRKTRVKIEPEPAGRLEQLLIEFRQAKDAYEEAEEAQKEFKAAIKAWVLSLFPDGKGLPEGFDITADANGRYPGLTMTLKGGRRVNTERMRQDGIYDQYADETTPVWELREATQGRRPR